MTIGRRASGVHNCISATTIRTHAFSVPVPVRCRTATFGRGFQMLHCHFDSRMEDARECFEGTCDCRQGLFLIERSSTSCVVFGKPVGRDWRVDARARACIGSTADPQSE